MLWYKVVAENIFVFMHKKTFNNAPFTRTEPPRGSQRPTTSSERQGRMVVKRARGTKRYTPTHRDDEDELTPSDRDTGQPVWRYGHRRITALVRRKGGNVDEDRWSRYGVVRG